MSILLIAARASSEERDADDSPGVDLASVAADRDGDSVTYTLTAFADVRPSDVEQVRIVLDLDGDGEATTADDPCITIAPVRTNLSAVLTDPCKKAKDEVAGDVELDGDTLHVAVPVSSLEDAGLDDDAASYGYRVRSVDAARNVDRVPDDGGRLITHELAAVTAQANTSPTASALATATATATPSPTPTGGGEDTSDTGTASKSSVARGESLTISGDGFAPDEELEISIDALASATSTATPSATPTTTPTATPTVSPTASPTNRTSLGDTTSEDDGTFEEGVTIPTNTTVGSHTIFVEGPNPGGGTHTVTIPITVTAAQETSVGSTPQPQANASPLPRSGGPIATLTLAGLLSLVTGAELLAFRRLLRRRR